MSQLLNASEKLLLRYWIADNAPGYSKTVFTTNGQLRQVPLVAADLAAIGVLDSDVVRGYLTNYQLKKVSQLSGRSAQISDQITNLQTEAANVTNDIATVQGVQVQAVPTAA